MSDPSTQELIRGIQVAQRLILKSTEGLPAEHFAEALSHQSPPVGWHLWHVARWADRLQATFSDPPSGAAEASPLPDEVWVAGDLAAAWGLEPGTLGVLQTGTAMEVAAAASVLRAGKDTLLAYARQAFDRLDGALAALEPRYFAGTRESVKAFRVADGVVLEAAGEQTTAAADLAFHFAHTNRHLGMIEALRGTLAGAPGTATV